jgi:two-component system OmpR family sensor kinase
MFRSLYAKLSFALLCLLALVGGLLVVVSVTSTELYRQEANQKLNRTLAELIVSEKDLMQGRRVNDAAVKNIFSMLMAVNPSIEVYLLDPRGRVLSYSAEPSRIKRTVVDLGPLVAFLEGTASYPILGDDPRSLSGRKIFTAARIPRAGPIEGYLYVILGGESYDTVLQKLQGSYILRLSLWVILVSILVTAGAGLALFAYLTRRLRRLTDAMTAYAGGTAFEGLGLPEKDNGRFDEIGRLTATFRQMAERIGQQVESLRNADAQRRELIAGVSHDLRTPLATLQGYIETLLMRDDLLSPAERKQYLGIAIRHCVHLSRLVEGLFDLAKLEAREIMVAREPFSIGELAQDVVQKYGLSGREKGVLLRTNAGEDIPFVSADIALIGRVLDNLVENAVRHTPQGGSVDVNLQARSNRVVVTVRDTGSGIAPEDLAHIFQRFHRGRAGTLEEDGHAGLGLAIVKKILELHGSSIEVWSVPGKGAAFTFSLPMYHSTS